VQQLLALISAPDVLEPSWRKLRVAHRALDRAVAEVGLQGPGIGSPIGQGIAGCVSEHVRVSFEWQLGLDACPLDQFGETRDGEGHRAAMQWLNQ
jgi:hypothetical protein